MGGGIGKISEDHREIKKELELVLDNTHHELGNVDIGNVDLSNLSEQERHRIEHAEFHKKHKGHEAMHSEMVLILIAMIILGQFALVQWRQKSPKTYHMTTLLLLWIVPFAMSVYYHWTRFIVIWLLFSILTG